MKFTTLVCLTALGVSALNVNAAPISDVELNNKRDAPSTYYYDDDKKDKYDDEYGYDDKKKDDKDDKKDYYRRSAVANEKDYKDEKDSYDYYPDSYDGKDNLRSAPIINKHS
ncbi:hypothetical protein RhiirA4_470539 [Rhizophagus irregularis]|uniref:Secreted protein n=1 Tax=Rhizophagus irregularis TaxID=588596 RepID=A0A2I1H1L8_9GLOM|nr:hypothetical protein RhiirA4_470539 [Rhizophagus irregularis]